MGVNRAYVESLLVGVSLPASRADLIAYARRQPGGASVAERLRVLPDRAYRSLPDVGEALEPVQPQRRERTPPPRAESDLPPGGGMYAGRPRP